MKRRKLHVESLIEDAEEWFFSMPYSKQTDVFLACYMKEKKIKKSEVVW